VKRRLAIVGAGASGALLATQLLRQAQGPLEVLLYERSGVFGQGVAYSTNEPAHLLNVPAAKMSGFPDDPEHFLRWARDREPGTKAGSFVARRTYGQYLSELLVDAEARARPRVRLIRIPEEVADLVPALGGRSLRVVTHTQELTVDAVVLALGHAAPADLPVPDGGLYASNRYRRSPWVSGALDGVPARAPVLLLGTGLTFVDVVLSLVKAGHTGTVYALSRRGLLPRQHLTGSEAVSLDVPERASLRQLLRAVRRRAETGAVDARAVVDGLRPLTQTLWQGFSLEERRRFLRHLRAHWDVHRHRMAEEIGTQIRSLSAEGRLRIFKGRLRSFSLRPDGVDVHLAGSKEPLLVSTVVNCTGPTGVGATPASLVRRLLEQGLVSLGPLGLGPRVDLSGRALPSEGPLCSPLYLIGPLRKELLWESVAIPEIRVQASDLAGHLLAQLEEK
jgi:uncharacterized NAD(P)/FAD-binding protein YdhS